MWHLEIVKCYCLKSSCSCLVKKCRNKQLSTYKQSLWSISSCAPSRKVFIFVFLDISLRFIYVSHRKHLACAGSFTWESLFPHTKAFNTVTMTEAFLWNDTRQRWVRVVEELFRSLSMHCLGNSGKGVCGWNTWRMVLGFSEKPCEGCIVSCWWFFLTVYSHWCSSINFVWLSTPSTGNTLTLRNFQNKGSVTCNFQQTHPNMLEQLFNNIRCRVSFGKFAALC